MPVPLREIVACRAAHLRLGATVAGLGDEDLAKPSRLPGWSVGHVLTHLARNADSVVRRLEGARAGLLVEQYPGGGEARAAEIAAGARRAPDDIRRDVVTAGEAVDAAFAQCSSEVWDAPILLGSGEQRPAAHLAVSRWREVEIHHVDLDVGYTHRDWEAAFVERFLPEVMTTLPTRAEPSVLLAWALGRADAPDLGPWG